MKFSSNGPVVSEMFENVERRQRDDRGIGILIVHL